jgi:hypothetical protein
LSRNKSLINIFFKFSHFVGSGGKKTALLQTLVVRLLVRFANVLFCVVAGF